MTISEYIEQDLASRISAGTEVPPRITVGALAKTYGVSATPVRTALRNLVSKDLLVRHENGRLTINDSGRGFGQLGRSGQDGTPEPISPPSLPVDWDAVLAREILIMSLRGSDGFVREEVMADKHGIGRTLLRSVFHRLAGGGLIEHIPRCGWRVRAFSNEDMEAYIAIRETLEVKALELARQIAGALDPRELKRMLEGNSESAVATGQIDNTLHAYFVRQSGNRYIASFFETHGGYYAALFDYAALGANELSDMAAQHRDILEGVLKRRWARARTALSTHIHSQRIVMQKVIARIS